MGMYPEYMVAPIREDLTSVGFEQLMTPEEVEQVMKQKARTSYAAAVWRVRSYRKNRLKSHSKADNARLRSSIVMKGAYSRKPSRSTRMSPGNRPNQPSLFPASNPSATSYTWSTPNAQILFGENPTVVNVTTATSGLIQIAGSANGCVGFQNISVTVNPAPSAAFTLNTTGTTVSLNATGTGTYSWTASGGVLSSHTAVNPTVTYPATGTYTISLTVTNNGCSATTSQIVSVVSGLENELSMQTQVYPNPTNGLIQVKLPAEVSGNLTLKLFTALGQQVQIPAASTSAEIVDLNLTGLAEGAYLLQLETPAGIVRKQVLLQK